jgi:hypothetical protein
MTDGPEAHAGSIESGCTLSLAVLFLPPSSPGVHLELRGRFLFGVAGISMWPMPNFVATHFSPQKRAPRNAPYAPASEPDTVARTELPYTHERRE